MRINNNLPALTAFKSLNATNKSLQKSINALSTGLRINSAADDAAGFAISEKMRSQITGLDIALRDAQDGISFLQTAEGALGDVNSILQRMRELSVQASNDSLTSNDRQYIQLEVDELRDQINRIAGTTQFNKKRILDGSSGALWASSDLNVKARIRGGLTHIDQFGQKIKTEGNYRIDINTEPGNPQVRKSNIMTTWSTETEDGPEPENVTETVRTIAYNTVTETETQLVETQADEELFKIYLNGESNDNPQTVDNLIRLPENATQEQSDAVNALRDGMSFSNGVLTITADGTYNIVTRGNAATTNRIRVAAGVNANIFLTDVNINVSSMSNACAFKVEPGATANVYLSGDNSLISNGAAAGLEVPYGATLTLTSADGDGQTSGRLTARGGGGAFYGAGIGGHGDGGGYASSGRAGNITINGGTITATGGYYAAGIGGADSHDRTNDGDGCGNIVINGGIITATGGSCAPGIGHGDGTEAYTVVEDSITINGGTITATSSPSGARAAGIGGGNGVNSGRITISSNATITASGYMADGTSAIGSGISAPQGENDSVTYTDDPPELRDSVPDRLMIGGTIREEREVEVTRSVPYFAESTRTVSITPPPSLDNELENLTVYPANGVDTMTANGLPAGSYTVKTLDSPNTANSYNLTGSYGFSSDLSGLFNLNAGSGALTTNANILLEVTDVNASSGTVTLKATANLMATDGTVTKHIVRENLIVKEGVASALSGLNLSGYLDYDNEKAAPAVTMNLASGAARSFSVGNKFVYNITPSGFSREERTVEISGTQDSNWSRNWGGDVTNQPVLYQLNAESTANKTLTFSNFYLNSLDGTVYEGDVVLASNSNTIQNGTALAKFDALRDDPEITESFKTADEDTKLSEVSEFYNTEGVFLLQRPQTLRIMQGDGKTASITIYSSDTIGELRDKINDAIANDLGQIRYTDSSKFVSFVTEAQNQGLETVPGTFIIRSVIPGRAGELSFSGDEDLLKALGINTIQESSESSYTASIYEAHSGKVIKSNAKLTGNILHEAIGPNIDLEFDSLAGVQASWNENTKRYILSCDDTYSAVIHLKDNAVTFQTGANKGEDFIIQLGDTSSFALGIDNVNLLTRETASRSIGILDQAINRVSTQRAKIGAYNNALEHTIANLTTTSANLTNAESRIRDVDMALEMMNFVKLQILNQSGTSMLAQANNLPQSVMSLMQ